jgi:hypothetical protein
MKNMSMVARLWNQRHRVIAGVRPLLKAALIDVGLRLMCSPRTGPRLTRVVQRVVGALVRWGGLADA